MSPALRTALVLCIPGMLLAIGVRVDLLRQVPEAWYNTDVIQVVRLAEHFLETGEIRVPHRRTFLPALQYAIPMSQGTSALRFAALTQHAIGLGFVVLMGLATVVWTRRWRWWIVPVTLAAAVHPVILWYEHLALPDSMQMTFVVAASVAGWHFLRRPGPAAFALLLLAVFLAAGARQEGRYFCAFVLAATVVAHWGRPGVLVRYLAVALVFSAVTFHWTRTNQGGQILLTALVHVMPDELPGREELSRRLLPHRERSRREWIGYPPVHNGRRKEIRATLRGWIMETEGVDRGAANRRIDPLARDLAVGIAVRNPHDVPLLALAKGLAGFDRPALPGFGEHYFPEFYIDDIVADGFRPEVAAALHGRPFQDALEIAMYTRPRYPALPADWIGNRADVAAERVRSVRLPAFEIGIYRMGGAPVVWVLAGLGLLATAARGRKPLGFHVLWLGCLAFVTVAMLAGGPVRTRYRLLCTPFVLLGVAAFADLGVAIVHAGLRRARGQGAGIAAET